MKLFPRIGAAIGVLAGAYALFLRPRILRWGATPKELREGSPADRIIPGGKRGSLMAATIDAPPSAVWPWLVQMGFDRAGWYSWDLLDRLGIPSAREVHPEWQAISVGQRLWATPDAKHWFEVAAVDPERFLALRSASSGGRQYDSLGPRPRRFSDALWSFQLFALPGQRTRLIVRTHVAAQPAFINRLASALFWEPAHFIMQLRQFGNLARRAQSGRPVLPQVARPRVPSELR